MTPERKKELEHYYCGDTTWRQLGWIRDRDYQNVRIAMISRRIVDRYLSWLYNRENEA